MTHAIFTSSKIAATDNVYNMHCIERYFKELAAKSTNIYHLHYIVRVSQNNATKKHSAKVHFEPLQRVNNNTMLGYAKYVMNIQAPFTLYRIHIVTT